MEFSYPPVHTNAPKLKSDCYKPMAVLLQLRELVAARLPTSLEELTRIARVIRLALASTAMLALGPTGILPVASGHRVAATAISAVTRSRSPQGKERHFVAA